MLSSSRPSNPSPVSFRASPPPLFAAVAASPSRSNHAARKLPDPPASAPPAHVVDRALEQSVSALSRLLRQRGGSAGLENDVDAHDLLTNIKSHLNHLSVVGTVHATTTPVAVGEETAPIDPFDEDPAQNYSNWSPPTAQPESKTPFGLWTARRSQTVDPSSPFASPASTAAMSSVTITEREWSSLVDRLNDSLRKHKVKVGSAQQDLLAAELAKLTFHPNINSKSRKMATLLSLPERTAQIEEKRKEKLETERARLRDKELDGATFHPKINSSHSSTLSRVMSPSGVRERREALAQRLTAQREAEERENLTFSPALNPRSLAMAPRGKAMANAGSPARPLVSNTHLDAGHEHETFRPAINARSKRLVTGKSKPVYERLYDERPRTSPAAGAQQLQQSNHHQATSSPIKDHKPAIRNNTVVFRPEMEFILEHLKAAKGGESSSSS